ncbi:MAG: imidazoleglycerol-phosphate dehydratase HisB [Provencibacterium sp.]|nr:imidazoleglycerol-phosphate dehydratase HisB [Provencibacterium sp.]
MRASTITRKTKETDITVRLALDGTGEGTISTGIGFFDHMLSALRTHAGLDLTVQAAGDLEVDCHHTIEDVGIVLGRALGEALGDRAGIARYGSSQIPMDEALGVCILDISGRPFLRFDCAFSGERVGALDTAMAEEFFRALAMNAGITLHLAVPYGNNDHHKLEALFKALAHALRQAVQPAGDGRPLSTKGVLA